MMFFIIKDKDVKRGKYDAIINEWCRGGTDNQENRRKGRGEIFP